MAIRRRRSVTEHIASSWDLAGCTVGDLLKSGAVIVPYDLAPVGDIWGDTVLLIQPPHAQLDALELVFPDSAGEEPHKYVGAFVVVGTRPARNQSLKDGPRC